MKNAKEVIERVIKSLEEDKCRGAWAKGVNEYAKELAEDLKTVEDWEDLFSPKMLEKHMLNGAADWEQYSLGGCSLIYNRDIAERLCNPTELKRTKYGNRRPNAREGWLDTQARALYQASKKVQERVHAITTLYALGK